MSPAHTRLAPLRLKPGELLICREPHEVTTVLGSCVSITMFNARLGLAAICHAMLPSPGPQVRAEDSPPKQFKYVTHAVPAMAAAFRRAGAHPAEIQVNLFGGANVLGSNDTAERLQGVGPANVCMARKLLQEENLHIRAANVGGRRGRKLLFDTLTGRVLHKHLA